LNGEQKAKCAQKLAMMLLMTKPLALATPLWEASSVFEKLKKSMYRWMSGIENGVWAMPSGLARFSG